MQITIIVIILVYVALLFGISFYAKSRAGKGKESFLLADRKLSVVLVAASIVGLAIGGASTIGVAERSFNSGLSAGWYTAAWGIGAIVMGFAVSRKYRELNITTFPELIGKYFGKESRVLCVTCQIVIQLTITSLQYVAGGAILTSMLPDVFTLQTGILFSAVVFIGTTFIGGMMTVGMTNVLNVALIYGGVILSTISIITREGGMPAILSRVPADVPYIDLVSGVGVTVIVGWIMTMITQNLSLQSIMQISCSAKSGNTAKRGFLLGGLIMIPCGFLCALIGIAAKSISPDIAPTLALPGVIMSLAPVAAGITLAALWAADVSTASALLMGSGTLVSQDIYKALINPKASEKQMHVANKVIIAALGLLTLILSMNASGILKTLTAALSLTTGFSMVVLAMFYAPKLLRKSTALVTMAAAILTLILWYAIPQLKALSPEPIYLEWVVCAVTFIAVYAIDKRPAMPSKAELDDARQNAA